MNIPPKDDPPISFGDYAPEFAPAPLAIAPDGGIAPGIAAAGGATLPRATPQEWVCLRGPCQNFLTLQGSFDSQNTKASGEGFKRRYYYCTAIHGSYIELEDEVIYDCNRWDPEDPSEPDVYARDLRRQAFFARHPELAPKTNGA
jgi:hypothetical protein